MDLSRILNNQAAPVISNPTAPGEGLVDSSHTLSNVDRSSAPLPRREPLAPISINTTSHLPSPFPSSPPPVPSSLPPVPSSPPAQTSSWSERNPTYPTQPKVSRPAPKTTAAGKAAKKQRKEENRAKKALFDDAVQVLIEQLEDDIQELAEQFNKSVADVKAIVLSTSSKPKRKLSDANVLLMLEAHLANVNNEPAQHALKQRLPRIRADLANNKYSAAEIKAAHKFAEEHKKFKAQGIRASEKAAQTDALHTMNNVKTQLTDLFWRNGIVSLLLLSRSSVMQTFTPVLFEVVGSGGFFKACLGKEGTESVLLYDQFNCIRDIALPPLIATSAKKTKKSTVKQKQKEVVELISKLLAEATNQVCTQMSYTSYDKSIRYQHHVEIIGWPPTVPFKRPSTITNGTHLKLLLDAIANETLHFASVSAQDLVALTSKFSSTIGAGKGKRKRTENDDDEEEEDENNDEDEEDKDKDDDEEEDEDKDKEDEEDEEEEEEGRLNDDVDVHQGDNERGRPNKRRRVSSQPQARSRSVLTNTDTED
ncbi:hypothetical protein BJ165DRAFT_1533231 [Panaeolus papilionaceus]|nr:hypothetical protein BJ165DRAFT_1533231 [Panaeolus papilionaceus]